MQSFNTRHSGESRNLRQQRTTKVWETPAFAGVTPFQCPLTSTSSPNQQETSHDRPGLHRKATRWRARSALPLRWQGAADRQRRQQMRLYGLEALYRKYRDRGFEILAFPCNQFGLQEPGNAEEIARFCSLTYDVTFPVFAKIDVNGPNADPLYDYIKGIKPGVLGTKGIKWNFTKFLVNREGAVVGRYAPTVKPEELEGEIEKLLG
jgi:glutathione peroxidase